MIVKNKENVSRLVKSSLANKIKNSRMKIQTDKLNKLKIKIDSFYF